MASLFEHYKTLGVNVGAGIADVTSSYKQLCRKYHPDISADPGSEEQMKKINIAYTVLREKLRREAAFRERQTFTRPARKYTGAETRPPGPDTRTKSADSRSRSADEEADKEAYAVLYKYFKAISAFDYSSAYDYLSSNDKSHISRESFVQWRKSVARLYPLREFRISSGSTTTAVTWSGGKTFYARKFSVEITEENLADDSLQTGDVEKLVANEYGSWKILLGYNSVGELTRTFDERFETKCKRDFAKRWQEYYTGQHQEYNMLTLAGMRKTVSREIYRQKRFGGSITFAVISIKADGASEEGQEELQRSAAKTICGVLRETDVSAYAGDGVFAILFVELRRKNASDIINRLIEKIRKNAGPRLGARADIRCEFEIWSEHNCADMEAVNKILKKFRKKM